MSFFGFGSPHPPRVGTSVRFPGRGNAPTSRVGHPPRYPLHSWARNRRPDMLTRWQAKPPPGEPSGFA